MQSEVELEILKFIKSDKSGVLVIKGSWGIGKTYTWRELMKQFLKEGPLKDFNMYSYVSLFGLNSLNDLKSSVVGNMRLITQPKKVTGKNSSTAERTFAQRSRLATERNTNSALVLSQIGQYLSSLPTLKAILGDAWKLGWLRIENAIICVDDLERAGSKLDPRDIFGIISQLKEEKNCKVILILNEKELHGAKLKSYNEYREKIVSQELQFAPAFDKVSESFLTELEANHSKLILQSMEKLGTTNLRTLEKIKNNYEELLPIIETYSQNLQTDALSALVFFTHIHFTSDERFPAITEILNLNTQSLLGSSMSLHLINNRTNALPGDDKKRHATELIQNIVDIYKWSEIHELDREIATYIWRGRIHLPDLNRALALTEEALLKFHKRTEIKSRVDRIGKLTWDLLEDNFEELVTEIKKLIEKMSEDDECLGTLNQYTSVLENFGKKQEATELINFYIHLNKDKDLKYFDIHKARHEFFNGVNDTFRIAIEKKFTELRAEKVAEKSNSLTRKVTFEEFLDKTSKGFPDFDDLKVMQSFSSEELAEQIKLAYPDQRLGRLVEFLSEPSFVLTPEKEYVLLKLFLKTNLITAIEQIRKSSDKAKVALRPWATRLRPELETVTPDEE